MNRTTTLQIRLTPEQKALVQGIAKETGLSVSDYVRECIFGNGKKYGKEGDARFKTREGTMVEKDRKYRPRKKHNVTETDT